MNPLWIVLLLIYGVLCALTGAAIISPRTRRPPGAGLIDPITLTAMRALKDNHPGEFARLHTAETTRTANHHRRTPRQGGQDGQDGGDHA